MLGPLLFINDLTMFLQVSGGFAVPFEPSEKAHFRKVKAVGGFSARYIAVRSWFNEVVY